MLTDLATNLVYWHSETMLEHGLLAACFASTNGPDDLKLSYPDFRDNNRRFTKDKARISTAIQNLTHVECREPAILQAICKDNIGIVINGKAVRQILTSMDGVVTHVLRQPFIFAPADCPSIFLLDKVTHLAAIVHATWATLDIVIYKAVQHLMVDVFSVNPRNIMAAIGPSIHSCCYGFPLGLTGQLGNPDWKPYLDIDYRNDFARIDLQGYLADRLRYFQIPAYQIEDSEICTSCAKNEDDGFIFPSNFREHGIQSRLAAVMMLT